MDKHLISIENTLLQALTKLNDLSGAAMTLFVVDDEGCMRGTVTDGDIRRAVISGVGLDRPVSEAMHTDFASLDNHRDNVEKIRHARARGIRLLPVLDNSNRLVSILDLSVQTSALPLSAVIMAGGKGERLRPLTLSTPKPLLEIGGKAIINYNVEALAKCGINNITVTTNYLAEKIEAHFSTPVAGVKVKCVRENLPMGTIGSAVLADLPAEGNTLVMNSDLLTTISFEDMYLHHRASGSDITIAAVPYQVSVPYAILSTDPHSPEAVTGLEEKPSFSYFANAGIYIFPNSLLRALSTDTRTDATDLISMAIDRGLKVTYFPINGTWIDIGSPTDFRQAAELMKFKS